ncbi:MULTISPECIES: LytR/AlgR family response regulator transcription factor [Hydrocarboniphaga]|jgi:two-component system response regulator AlgR|uniref:LytR/AlgR family response regulator transcription factor n=1 Tax=Hydrocarboniphaga TaxID=243627 RepID=UPI00059075FF|nr:MULTISPECIES: LytTR family DNA-binding domain-containing protein [Hydrocarboniphaga]MDZ4080368.1 LytTR family DNA-binding domain-containing protein [Hydrocarboniphaga sp.]
MRVVIVDDEPLARERLRRLLSEFPGYEIVGEAGDGETALEVVDNEEPDLVLLDIRMGGVDGLQVARQLAEYDPPPAIIFTTAYSEHALSAFDANADAYLLKPIRVEKLKEALLRARRPTRAHKSPATASAVSNERPKREFVLATTREGLVRIPAEDIVYFLADQKYTTVCHLHGEVLIEESLKTLEEDFAPWFLRIHRKALVATRFIASLERERTGEQHHWLRMKHAAKPLPVSRRRLAEVRRFLTES